MELVVTTETSKTKRVKTKPYNIYKNIKYSGKHTMDRNMCHEKHPSYLVPEKNESGVKSYTDVKRLGVSSRIIDHFKYDLRRPKRRLGQKHGI